jgi:hypothetical protein
LFADHQIGIHKLSICKLFFPKFFFDRDFVHPLLHGRTVMAYIIVEEEQESRTTLPQGGGDDAGWLSDTSTSRPSSAAPPIVDATPWPTSPPSGPTTQTHAIYVKVNSFLSMGDLDITLDGLLPHAYVYMSLGTNLVKEPKGASRSRGEGSHMVHGRRREDRRRRIRRRRRAPAASHDKAGTAAPTWPALPVGAPRHCRPIFPGTAGPTGTAAPNTPALPAPSKSTSSQPSIYHLLSPLPYCNAPFTPGRIWAYI